MPPRRLRGPFSRQHQQIDRLPGTYDREQLTAFPSDQMAPRGRESIATQLTRPIPVSRTRRIYLDRCGALNKRPSNPTGFGRRGPSSHHRSFESNRRIAVLWRLLRALMSRRRHRSIDPSNPLDLASIDHPTAIHPTYTDSQPGTRSCCLRGLGRWRPQRPRPCRTTT